MLTRCPLCNTTFRVTAEQIKARQGRVRCGACQEVFDALDHLIDAVLVTPTPAAPAAAAEPEPVAAAEAASEHELAQAGDSAPAAAPRTDAEADLAALAADFGLAPGPEPQEPGTDHGFGEPGEAATAAAIPPPAPAVEPEPALPDAPTPEPATAASPPILPDVPAPAPPAAEPEFDAADLEPVDFSIMPGFEDAPPRRRTWPWALAGAIAVVVLAAQAALHFRTAIAIAYPDMKPALAAACGALGCEIELPHRHELVSIEASDLSPDPGGKLLLALTMKNRAAYAQEYPHLELTLTDTADGPLVRRVLAPADYLPPQTPIAAGFGASAELALSLLVEAPGIAAAGYRLYLFYP